MKHILTRFALIASLLFASAFPVAAQATLNQTTLSAGVTENATLVQVTSASTMAANDILYVDREAMIIRAVSGTNITVTRGTQGTRAVAHPVNAVAYSGVPARFYNSDPPFGRCTPSNQLVLPYINVVTGGIFSCRNVGTINTATSSTPPGLWGGTALYTYNDSRMPRRIVQNANYTVAPDDVVVAVTSISTTGQITITLPAATGLAGKILIIQDESGQLAANTASVWLAGTVNLQVLTSNTGSFINTAFGVVRLRAGCATPNGVVNACSWFAW